jgi:hypothetical protein
MLLVFPDIANYWAQSAIVQLQSRDVIKGYPDGTFRPDATITRAEFAVLMNKAFPEVQPQRTAIAFKDVPASHWAHDAIKKAYQREFFTGYPDGTFQPDLKLPRVQALVILANGLNYDPGPPSRDILQKYFEDINQIPSYAIYPVTAATLGLLAVNYPNVKQLKPNQNATRGEVSAFISQALGIPNAVPLQYVAGSEKFAIQPVFRDAKSFSEGLAAVKLTEKAGYIDKTGNFIILPQFDQAESFSQGLAAVLQETQWGYIDKTGKFVIQPQFTKAGKFVNGLAPVQINNKWGYIDTAGRQIVAPTFDQADPFSDGMARVKIGDLYGYINTTGTLIIQPQYKIAYSFSEGLAGVYAPPERVGELSKWGYIDNTGKFVIPPTFDFVYPFSEGLAKTTRGYIDKTGNVVLSPQNVEDSLAFVEGFAAAKVGTRWGYIDKTGKIVIPPQFYAPQNFAGADVEPFSENLAVVRFDKKAGFIDQQGNFVFPPHFDFAKSFSEGMALVNIGGQWNTTVGYDSSATPVIESSFSGGKWGYVRHP